MRSVSINTEYVYMVSGVFVWESGVGVKALRQKMSRAYGSFDYVGFVVDGLKPVPTRWAEPTALLSAFCIPEERCIL